VEQATGIAPELSGNAVTLRTDQPQHALYRLTSWAENEHIELDGLTVTRPSLDDVFLELTGAEDEPGVRT
jgi:ABC-2 type transport system ATP-binding protein